MQVASKIRTGAVERVPQVPQLHTVLSTSRDTKQRTASCSVWRLRGLCTAGGPAGPAPAVGLGGTVNANCCANLFENEFTGSPCPTCKLNELERNPKSQHANYQSGKRVISKHLER